MNETAILKEIKQEFLVKLKDEKIVDGDDILDKLSDLLNGEREVPTIDQLKNILFREELL